VYIFYDGQFTKTAHFLWGMNYAGFNYWFLFAGKENSACPTMRPGFVIPAKAGIQMFDNCGNMDTGFRQYDAIRVFSTSSVFCPYKKCEKTLGNCPN